MKIRRGFVSNSSSSSFIVAFDKDKVPQTVEEMKALLFKKGVRQYRDPYDDDMSWPVMEIAIQVLRDLHEGGGYHNGGDQYDKNSPNYRAARAPLTDAQLVEEFTTGWIDEQPELHDTYYDLICSAKSEEEKQKVREEMWDDLHKRMAVFAQQKAEEFKKANPDSVFYRFEYSDGDGQRASAMEHGDLFNQLPHFKISHH